MKKIILSIGGMTCSACSNGLEKYLNKQNGVYNAVVNLVMANAVIEYDENILNQEKIEEFVKKSGFKSLGKFKEIKIEQTPKKERIKLIIFTLLAIVIMYISMGYMIGMPNIAFFNPYKSPNTYMFTLLLLSTSFLVYGHDIIKNGYKNLIHKVPNMDTLVGIGVITSFLYSLYNMYLILNGNPIQIMNLYFESTSIVIYFVKLGRYIDRISKDKTKEAIQKLVKITPNTATIKRDGIEIQVTLDEIKKGDILISKAGEKIAVDGEIIFGKAHVDESFITGESKPVQKNVREKVIAGSINYDGYIEYKAQRIGKESTISEIVRMVVDATSTKAPIAKIVDKVSGYFVPVVILIAIITLLAYLILGKDFSDAITTFATILVVACPCSLGLATPLAIVVSEGICASNGILIKKSEILENAKKVNTIVFDKTGTLTYGKLKISEIINYTDIEENKILQLVGSLESKGTHPIGKAFTDYLEENNIEYLKIKSFENITGRGMIGKINEDEILIGNSKMLAEFQIQNNHLKDEKSLAKKGNTIVYFVKNKQIIAIIGVNDIIRENAKEVISYLSNINIDSIMLTGDNKEVAELIAKEIEITKVISDVLPSEKAGLIKKLKEENKFVMMCGDGINDSPALASSDIGISVSSGMDIAKDSADVILTKNNLYSIVNLINISKKTVKIIKQNLFWAFFYNSLMIPIAMGILKPIGIHINPMIASLAMVLSSITVIINTLRLKSIKF